MAIGMLSIEFWMERTRTHIKIYRDAGVIRFNEPSTGIGR